MKNFLKNFFTGNKTAEEKTLKEFQNTENKHDVIKTESYTHEEDKKDGCGSCGSCNCK